MTAPVAEIKNLKAFPKLLHMTHGEDGEREWWDWHKDSKKVVIQRRIKTPKTTWTVYFLNGGEIGCLYEDDTMKRSVGGEVETCVSALAELCFKVVFPQSLFDNDRD
jgi:hypothetical protein